MTYKENELVKRKELIYDLERCRTMPEKIKVWDKYWHWIKTNPNPEASPAGFATDICDTVRRMDRN